MVGEWRLLMVNWFVMTELMLAYRRTWSQTIINPFMFRDLNNHDSASILLVDGLISHTMTLDHSSCNQLTCLSSRMYTGGRVYVWCMHCIWIQIGRWYDTSNYSNVKQAIKTRRAAATLVTIGANQTHHMRCNMQLVAFEMGGLMNRPAFGQLISSASASRTTAWFNAVRNTNVTKIRGLMNNRLFIHQRILEPASYAFVFSFLLLQCAFCLSCLLFWPVICSYVCLFVCTREMRRFAFAICHALGHPTQLVFRWQCRQVRWQLPMTRLSSRLFSLDVRSGCVTVALSWSKLWIMALCVCSCNHSEWLLHFRSLSPGQTRNGSVWTYLKS